MSLEEVLAANTAALIANTAALTGGAAKATPAAAGKAAAAKAAPAAAAKAAGPDLKKVTEDFMHLANTYGRDDAVAILGRYGAAKCSLVPAEKLGAFHTEVLAATVAAKAAADGATTAGDDDLA